jgi:hypothetical protein
MKWHGTSSRSSKNTEHARLSGFHLALGNTPEMDPDEAALALVPRGLGDSLASLIADLGDQPEKALEPFAAWCRERRYEIEVLAFVDGWRL